MVVTGRFPLLLLLGLVPVVLRPEASTVRLWILVVAVLVVADVLLSPSVKALAISRRLGQKGRMAASLAEIGQVIGVGESRVSQLRSLALSRLRTLLRESLGAQQAAK